MSTRNQALIECIQAALGEKVVSLVEAFGEVTLVVKAGDLLAAMTGLRDRSELGFEQLIDLCGVDYSTYSGYAGARFAVVYQLLSLANNRRLRVRVFCAADDFPLVD